MVHCISGGQVLPAHFPHGDGRVIPLPDNTGGGGHDAGDRKHIGLVGAFDKGPHIVVGGGHGHPCGGVYLDDLAVPHGHRISQLKGLVDIVGDKEDGLAQLPLDL